MNGLDPDAILAAAMLGYYPDRAPEDRLRMLVDHAECGLREIAHQVEIGTFDLIRLAFPDKR